MPLLTRLRLIQVKLETVKGTGVTPDTDVLAYDFDPSPEDDFIERKLSGIVLGHTSPGIPDGAGAGKISFKAECRGTGSGGLNAGLAILVQCCGIAKASEVYTPTSVYATQKTCSIAYYLNGKKFLLTGCMGNMVLTNDGGRLICEFEMSGVWNAPTDVALPTPTYGTGMPIMWSNASNTYTLGGVSMFMSTFNFNFGNQVVPRVSGGRILHYMITDRDPVITFDPDEELCATYDAYAAWLAGTEAALSMVLNNTADKVTIAVTKLQLRNPKQGDRDGKSTNELTAQCNFNSAGDDEYSLTFAAVA